MSMGMGMDRWMDSLLGYVVVGGIEEGSKVFARSYHINNVYIIYLSLWFDCIVEGTDLENHSS